MKPSRRFLAVAVTCFAGYLTVVSTLNAADSIAGAPPMPPAPKVSTFAPAEDLANQLDQYIKNLETALASADEYADLTAKIANNANTAIVVALALGLHDQDSKYKAHAPALMKAAGQIAAAKDYASAQKGLAALKDAAADKGDGAAQLKWEKVASLPELMKEVPMINTPLKMNLKGKKFKTKAKTTAAQSATLAAIAQGSMADTSKATNAEQVAKWYDLMGEMRDHAGAINAAIHKEDEAAAAEAMKKLSQNCDDCHETFNVTAITE